MGFEEIDSKYLDPAVNPMLPGSTAPAFKEKIADPNAKYLDPAKNPMIDAPAETGSMVEAEILAGKISAAFPDKMEVEVGDFKIVKMADGNFRIGGKLLAELPAATLEAINAAIR